MRKVTLTGSVSVGKTTVFNCVKRIFEVTNAMDRVLADPGPLVSFVGEAAREILTENPYLDRTAFKTDYEIANRAMYNEQQGTKDGTQILLCDRGVLDSLAFTRAWQGSHYDVLKAHLTDHLQTYDKFLLFSPEDVPFVCEGIRIEDSTFRLRLHEVFLGLLRELGLPYRLVEGPTVKRIHTVLEELLTLSR